MKRFPCLVILLVLLMVIPLSVIKAQDEKIDFKAEWRTDSVSNFIKITIIKGEVPFNCYIYNSSPFEGGTIIRQLENIVSRDIQVQIDDKSDVYICVYKGETNLAGRWFRINKK